MNQLWLAEQLTRTIKFSLDMTSVCLCVLVLTGLSIILPVTCNMSIDRSKVIIKKFFAFSGYSLHEIKIIESILDKTSGKVNTTILKGPH